MALPPVILGGRKSVQPMAARADDVDMTSFILLLRRVCGTAHDGLDDQKFDNVEKMNFDPALGQTATSWGAPLRRANLARLAPSHSLRAHRLLPRSLDAENG
ncbi:MAG: hypothetical protein ACSLE1_03825 [Sphingobium sp.]